MWSTAECFDRLTADLGAQGFRCHAPTLPHHDISPDAPAPAALGTQSLTDYVDALQQAMDAFDRNAWIVGHSMGGLLAQLLAARGMGRGLILLAPAPMAGANTTLPSPTRIFLPTIRQWGFWRKPHKPAWSQVRWGIFNGVPENEARAWFKSYVWESGRALAELAFWWADPGKASRVATNAVTGPVKIIVGARDRITPPAYARHAARRYGQRADLDIVDGAGHWLIGEPWLTETSTRMAHFLSAHAHTS